MFCNFLLADEINRAPAKVQSALLEVMQERQVTIGHETHRVPAPFLVMATQNPIESEGTYPLPEAQVDRFMFKLVVDYPAARDEVAVVERSLAGGGEAREVLSPAALARHQQRRAGGLRRPARDGVRRRADDGHARRATSKGWVEFGASPRGSINLVHAGRALALLRGRDYVLPTDVRDLARDVLRHRIVLTYEALAAGVDADRVLDDVLEQVPVPRIELAEEAHATAMSFREPLLLAGLALVPLALLAYWAAQRRRRRYAIRYPAVDVLAGVAGRARGRHLPALLALLVARRARRRARPPRAHDRGRAAPGHRDARARHVGLDAGDRRRARPAERGARGRAHARALAAGGVPARRRSRSTRASSRSPSRRPTARRCCARSTR